MLALAELQSEELLALCTEDNQLSRDSVPVRMSNDNYARFRRLHVVDGRLIGVTWPVPTVAKLIEDAYSLAALWLEGEGYAYLDSGSYRYVVDVGDGLILKAPFSEYAEWQNVNEAKTSFKFPTVDRCMISLPNGVQCLLQERLEHLGRKYSSGPLVAELPPVPGWVRYVSDGGQIGWSPSRKEWVCYDMGNEIF